MMSIPSLSDNELTRRAYNNRKHREYVARDPEHYRALERRYAKKKIRIAFMGKRIYLDWNPRTGRCSFCSRVCRTVMHHAKGYFWIFPWFGIEELCRSCHSNKHHFYANPSCSCSFCHPIVLGHHKQDLTPV